MFSLLKATLGNFLFSSFDFSTNCDDSCFPQDGVATLHNFSRGRYRQKEWNVILFCTHVAIHLVFFVLISFYTRRAFLVNKLTFCFKCVLIYFIFTLWVTILSLRVVQLKAHDAKRPRLMAGNLSVTRHMALPVTKNHAGRHTILLRMKSPRKRI